MTLLDQVRHHYASTQVPAASVEIAARAAESLADLLRYRGSVGATSAPNTDVEKLIDEMRGRLSLDRELQVDLRYGQLPVGADVRLVHYLVETQQRNPSITGYLKGWTAEAQLAAARSVASAQQASAHGDAGYATGSVSGTVHQSSIEPDSPWPRSGAGKTGGNQEKS